MYKCISAGTHCQWQDLYNSVYWSMQCWKQNNWSDSSTKCVCMSSQYVIVWHQRDGDESCIQIQSTKNTLSKHPHELLIQNNPNYGHIKVDTRFLCPKVQLLSFNKPRVEDWWLEAFIIYRIKGGELQENIGETNNIFESRYFFYAIMPLTTKVELNQFTVAPHQHTVVLSRRTTLQHLGRMSGAGIKAAETGRSFEVKKCML